MHIILRMTIVGFAVLMLPCTSWSVGKLSKKKAETIRSAPAVRIEVESEIIKEELTAVAASLLNKYGDFAVLTDSEPPTDESVITLKIRCKGEDVKGHYLLAIPRQDNPGVIDFDFLPDSIQPPHGAEIEGEITFLKSGKRLHKKKFKGDAFPPIVAPGIMKVSERWSDPDPERLRIESTYLTPAQQYRDTNAYKADPYLRAMAAEKSYVPTLLELLADIYGPDVIHQARLDADTLIQRAGASILTTEKEKQWLFRTEGLVFSSPAVLGETVFFGSWDRRFYAVEAKTGRERWKFKTGGRVVSDPAISEGVVFFGSEDSLLYALDAATGNELWKYQAVTAVSSSPVVSNGSVFFGSRDGIIHAVEAKTGQPVWQFQTSGASSKTPSVSGETVYVGYGDNILYALDARTGSEIWSSTLTVTITSPLTISQGVIYLGGQDDHLHAVSAETGEHLWKFRTYGVVYSGSVISGGIIYFGSADCYIYAVDIANGEERWHFSTGSRVYATPSVHEGVVYCASQDGKLYAIDALAGFELWKMDSGGALWSSPAVAGDLVLFGSEDKNLYAVDRIMTD